MAGERIEAQANDSPLFGALAQAFEDHVELVEIHPNFPNGYLEPRWHNTSASDLFLDDREEGGHLWYACRLYDASTGEETFDLTDEMAHMIDVPEANRKLVWLRQRLYVVAGSQAVTYAQQFDARPQILNSPQDDTLAITVRDALVSSLTPEQLAYWPPETGTAVDTHEVEMAVQSVQRSTPMTSNAFHAFMSSV